MAYYQYTNVLLCPSPYGYDEKSDPKAYADFMAIVKAYEKEDYETIHDILMRYEVKDGAIEEHDTNADWIVDVDLDGSYLLTKISECKTLYTNDHMGEVLHDIMSYIEQTEDLNEKAEYKRELEEVKDSWEKLTQSGVFHDAIGKVVKSYNIDHYLVVEIETEY
jgi:hypothetical protein